MGYRDLSSDRLYELLSLDPATGKLTWKPRPASMFRDHARMTAQQQANAWNGRFAGKPAIDCDDGAGYMTGMVLGNFVLAHRVIYCMTHGEWPAVIDHIDGKKDRNVQGNIRDVGSDAENAKNLPRRADNKSGVTGVSLDKKRGKWIVHAKGKHVGQFSAFQDAVAARMAANTKMGFHPNHGRRD